MDDQDHHEHESYGEDIPDEGEMETDVEMTGADEDPKSNEVSLFHSSNPNPNFPPLSFFLSFYEILGFFFFYFIERDLNGLYLLVVLEP